MFAKTIDELKQELIDHLATIDKTKLNMMDLNGYVTMLKMVDDMMKPDPGEYLKETMKAISDSYSNCVCGVADIPKVGAVDG